MRIARLVSLLFGPPVTAVMTATILAVSAPAATVSRLNGWLICVIMAVLPPFAFILWLYKTRRVTTIYLHERRERTLPYAVTVLCLLATLLALRGSGAPHGFQVLMAVYLINTLVLLGINLIRKISAHAVVLASSLVVLLSLLGSGVMPGFALIVPVAWARIQLRAHSPAEVLVGCLGALIASWLAVAFLVQIWVPDLAGAGGSFP